MEAGDVEVRRQRLDQKLPYVSAALGAMGFVVLSALFSVWATASVRGGGRMLGLPLVIAATWVPVTMSLGALVGFAFVRHGATLLRRPGFALIGLVAVLVGTLGAQAVGDALLTLRLDLPWTLSFRRLVWRSDAALSVVAVTLPASLCGSVIASIGAASGRAARAVALCVGVGALCAPVTLTQGLRAVGGFNSPAIVALLWGVPLLATGIYLAWDARQNRAR